MKRAHSHASVAFVLIALAAVSCESKKSSNPLSPHIAGPIPGVEITAPVLLEPGQGWKFKARQLPLTLLIENASSNGVRPLVYAIQIAVDSGFRNIVFTRRDIPQGANGRTAFRMTDKLQLGRTYYWRAWAYDGANTGATAQTKSFEVYPPVVLQPPQPMSPANGASGVPVTAQLIIRNSARSGPAGNIRYNYQVSRNSSFSAIVRTSGSGQPENGAGQTLWTVGGLAYGGLYYWRVQATDGEAISNWSGIASFRTGTAPSPGPGPVSCSPIPFTAIDILECHRSRYGTPMSSAQKLDFLRRSAHDMNVRGIAQGPFGILRKSGGANCSGYSCDIICAGQGTSQRQWDVLRDSKGDAVPTWGSPHVYPDLRVDTCYIQ